MTPRTLQIAGDADQAWFWTPEWQEGEREATQQAAEGAGEVFDSSEDFLAAFKPR